MNLHVGNGVYGVDFKLCCNIECFTDMNVADNNACTPEKPGEDKGACSSMGN